jgi:DNA mismatch repair protein MutL
MQNKEIKKLPQDIVNQIAAGEVIERPASIVKELLDNSIDAESTEITVSIVRGGMEKIEISDNGVGIDKDNLKLAFEPHATSKISSIEDFNNLLTMGFRGEALSTIQSIAKVKIVSKTKDSNLAYSITFNHGTGDGEITSEAHTNGTTVTVEDLFFNIPARQKFLRADDYEFRKILNILIPYLLFHPEIHFKIEKDSKNYLNLPRIESASPNTFHPIRIKEVLKATYTSNLLDFLYDGDGVRIGGYLAHPDFKSSKSVDSFIFVNNRPISDKGVIKSVYQGFSRFIPFGEKVPFLISISMNPSAVDVNVHPRKEEVRFMNPYRIYSAIEQAVSSALKKGVKLENESDNTYQRLREITGSETQNDFMKSNARVESSSMFDKGNTEFKHTATGRLREVAFGKNSKQFIKSSLDFSESLLKTSDESINPTPDKGMFSNINDQSYFYKSLHQIFNKYIIVEFEGEIWVVDQHAAAERASFERLSKNIASDTKNTQHLLLPVELDLSNSEYLYVLENKTFFESTGFMMNFDTEGEIASLTAVPSDLAQSDIQNIFKEIFDLSEDSLDLKNNFEKSREDILATMACHSSVRAGQKLSYSECEKIVRDLMKCENKYSCPHGRPAVWKQRIEDLDKHFLRTY